ncbi:hypothetical protein [Actinoplanes sp. G11-F43]|uniref:hypothetical protein n=1 Tax=Actinoplanes sp. G11-F43 TaxID=3424130 RepID=UPI003D327338
MSGGEVLDAAGPEQIRAAFTTAVDTADAHAGELGGLAGVLDAAADRYEGLRMTASTLEHLRDAATGLAAAAAAVGTGQQQLQAAAADFDARDGQVAQAVADAGNLMDAAGYSESFPVGTAAGAHSSRQETSMSSEAAAPAAQRGHYNPDQPRAADGKWVKVGDALGYADGETCFATDRVAAGAGGADTDLALIEYPDDGTNQVGTFVSVATPKGQFNPATGRESPRDDEDGSCELTYCAPQLAPDEAEAAADRLDELAGMVESGYRPPEPTKHTRARQRLELLLAEKHASKRERIGVGQDEEFPLTTGELLKLLVEADPTLSSPQTRHPVRARAAVAGGGEDGTVWLDIAPDSTGQMRVMVTAVEGTESPDDEFWQPYASQHTPESARELALKLRAFARTARRRPWDSDS